MRKMTYMDQLAAMPNVTPLNDYISVYVPTNTEANKGLLTGVELEMTRTFGGTTQYLTNGTYVMDDGTFVSDEVVVCKSFSMGPIDENAVQKVLDIINVMLLTTQEETIGMEINGTFYLVGRNE